MIDESRIRHPGPKMQPRVRVAQGHARSVTVTLPQGANLMQAVAAAMETLGCESAVMLLDGLQIGPYEYVMPGPSTDGVHAAWYSATYSGKQAVLRHATAIVGRRDQAWWLHCHAIWDDETPAPKAGHLLPDAVTLTAAGQVVIHAFDGGAFDVALDPETMFRIFHARPHVLPTNANALIAKVYPHEDIHTAITGLIRTAGIRRGRVLGIGSVIGAQFTSAPAMESPISEVLLLPGATWDGTELRLPMQCVDPDGGLFCGDVLPGAAPVCVTFELMVIADAD